MALFKKKASPFDETPIADHPDYQAVLAELADVKRQLSDVQQRETILKARMLGTVTANSEPLPDPLELNVVSINEQPEIKKIDEGIRSIKRRMEEAENRKKAALAVLREHGGMAETKKTVLAKAARLIAGGHIVSGDPRTEINAAEKEIYILKVAWSERRQEREKLVSSLSAAANEHYREVHRDILRAMALAMIDLDKAFSGFLALKAAITMRGYDFRLGGLFDQSIWAFHRKTSNSYAGRFIPWAKKRGLIDEQL